MLVDLAQPTWEEVRSALLAHGQGKRRIVAAMKLVGVIVLVIGVAVSVFILVEERERRRERIWFLTASEAPHAAGRPMDWIPYLEACTRAIGQHATALRPCVDRGDPTREGDVVVRFTIDPAGAADIVEMASTDLDPHCARTALRELRFEPPPDGAPIQVRCPYHLAPDGVGEFEVSAPRTWTQTRR